MSSVFSAKFRKEILRDLQSKTVDLLVIGGGITGAGIILDAVTRGLKTALVEMQDFAAGTSSRSTKLVHGGLRYLKQYEFKMVAEVGKERAIVYENGPHVTTPEWMLLPIYKEGTFGRTSTSLGLLLYDFLAGVKKSERRSMLTKEAVISKVPELRKEGLIGAGYYVEYRTDDARLTIEVVKKAVEKGASAVNYAKVIDFIYKEGKCVGVIVKDQIDGRTYKLFAKKIVNATGPWVDSLRKKDFSLKGKCLHLTKGVHLVFNGSRFPLRQAVYFDTPDGRMLFAIPREGKTYVGTTDTNYNGDPTRPKITVKDQEYVLQAIQYMFPRLNITRKDIESSWAGLRPLIHEDGKDPSQISRKDEIWTSDSGLISIAGGKLTGYRKMADGIVNLVCQQLNKQGLGKYPGSLTKNLPISGGEVGGSKGFPDFLKQQMKQGMTLGLSYEEAKELSSKYGANVKKIFTLIQQGKAEAESFQLPLSVYGQLIYALEHEMVIKPSDFFIRRTGTLFFNIQFVDKWKCQIVSYMSQKLNWSEEKKREYKTELEKEIYYARVPQIKE